MINSIVYLDKGCIFGEQLKQIKNRNYENYLLHRQKRSRSNCKWID